MCVTFTDAYRILLVVNEHSRKVHKDSDYTVVFFSVTELYTNHYGYRLCPYNWAVCNVTYVCIEWGQLISMSRWPQLEASTRHEASFSKVSLPYQECNCCLKRLDHVQAVIMIKNVVRALIII